MNENKMEKHFTPEELISYLENGEQDESISKHLRTCDPCRSELEELQEVFQAMGNARDAEPPASIRMHFESALAEQKAQLSSEGNLFGYWQIAAAVALLIVGFFAGKFTASDQQDKIIALESQVELLKEMATVNTLQSHTASERIKAVNMIEEEKTPKASDKLVKTLILTLNTDESPNVRYAAAQALNRFMDQESVRLALSESLERQEDPLIQILLISMLVEAQEKTAIKPIKELMEQDSVTPEVKKQAEVAIEILT